MIIYLDMDGVCADFITGVTDLFKHESLYTSWPPGVWCVAERMGISKTWLNQKIERAGVDFWAELKEYDHFRTLYNMLYGFGRVVFLSDPGLWTGAPSGKRIWLKERHGTEHKDWIFTPHKDLVHKSGTILVDDNPDNCAAHPNSILFPQPWNSQLWNRMDRVEYVKEEAERLLVRMDRELEISSGSP